MFLNISMPPTVTYTVRSGAGGPFLYIDGLKAVVTEVFRMYSNVFPEYNRSILTNRSTSYDVRNSKRLEIPTFHNKEGLEYIPFDTRLLNYGTC